MAEDDRIPEDDVMLAETPDEWPADAVHSAIREFIDVIAVMVPGAVEDATRIVYDTVKGWGAGPGRPVT